MDFKFQIKNYLISIIIRAIVHIILGAGFLFFGVRVITNQNFIKERPKDANTYVLISAEVIGYKEDRDNLKSIVVSYDVLGETYTQSSNIYDSSPKEIGTKVNIKYNPLNPNEFIWEDNHENIFVFVFAAVFITFGVSQLVLAVKLFITPRKKRKKNVLLKDVMFGMGFLLVGIGIIIFSVKTIGSYQGKNRVYIKHTSKIVDYVTNDDGLKAIVVSYEVNGEKYTKTSSTFSSFPRTIGTEIEIKYDPANPDDAIWVNDNDNIMLPVSGIVFALSGVFLIYTAIKDHKKQKTKH